MSNVNVCDQCAQRISEAGPRWHLECEGFMLSMSEAAQYPVDFCSLDCLATWSEELCEDRARQSLAKLSAPQPFTIGGTA